MTARCAFFKDKVKILKAKRKLQCNSIFIGEDFCARVRDIRRKLTPHLKAKRNEGCRVSMVFDHLLVDGKRFTVDDYNSDSAAFALESSLGRFMTRLMRAMLWEHIVG